MLSVGLIGALLFACGVVYTAVAAARRGRMSDPGHKPGDKAGETLEPRHRGLGFLGWKANWPGFLLMAAGALLLLAPVLLTAPAN
jgi:hypothetical protein